MMCYKCTVSFLVCCDLTNADVLCGRHLSCLLQAVALHDPKPYIHVLLALIGFSYAC